MKNIALFVLLFALGAITLGSCSPDRMNGPTLDLTAVFESAIQTATHAVIADPTQTAIPEATATPEAAVPTPTLTVPQPTIDPNVTPPALPAVYTTNMLNPLDTPHTYITDQCQYLRDKWTSTNARPGTVVMPIMFHSIVHGDITQPDQIKYEDFKTLMKSLNDMGFIPIATKHLRDFMYDNAYIPERSVVLIVDDRKHAQYFTDFEPFYAEYGWKEPIVNAWISFPETTQELYDENMAIQASGVVDHQAHGVIHNTPITEFPAGYTIETKYFGTLSAEQYVFSELNGSMQTITERYGVAPIAYIWPGGGFSALGVRTAREVGFELGFTINPRGPLMYNWVPLADSEDPARPSYLADGPMGDPLLVLPRYWDTDALYHLDTVRQISKDAIAYAEQGKEAEIGYYNIVCQAAHGSIP